MRYDVLLYTTFDADLICLGAAGISFPDLVREALYCRVRGKRIHYFINGCPKYELTGRKRKIHAFVKISDQASVDYLKRAIKPRCRSAFFKAIVREAFINLPVGVFYRHEPAFSEETSYIRSALRDLPDDVVVLEPSKNRPGKAYEKLLLTPAEAKEEASGYRVRSDRYKNRFGSVADLAPAQLREDKNEKEMKGKDEPAAGAAIVDEQHTAEAAVSAAEIHTYDSGGSDNGDDENMGYSDSDLLAAFMDM